MTRTLQELEALEAQRLAGTPAGRSSEELRARPWTPGRPALTRSGATAVLREAGGLGLVTVTRKDVHVVRHSRGRDLAGRVQDQPQVSLTLRDGRTGTVRVVNSLGQWARWRAEIAEERAAGKATP